MAALWFMAGVCFTLTAIILLLPWLRTIPGLGALPALPWQAGVVAVATAGIVFGLCSWLQPGNPAAGPQVLAASDAPAPTAASGSVVNDPWAGIANALGRGTAGGATPHVSNGPAPEGLTAGGGPTLTGPALAGPAKTSASPMNAAIASLQARLAKGGGSADDWELLAKSYEFLGQPAQASKARAHQLPALPADVVASSKVVP